MNFKLNANELGKRSLLAEYFDTDNLALDYLNYDHSLFALTLKSEIPVISLLQKTYSCEEFRN